MYMEQQASLLKALIQRPQEYLVGFGVVMILAVMVMPIPPFLLDLLLSFSITFALIILLVSIFMQGPLDFSVFPSLLLIVTLIRLSLNVASTRIILLHGDEGISSAGDVIESFGSFVSECRLRPVVVITASGLQGEQPLVNGTM